MIKSYHFSVLCFRNICLLLIFIMFQYSCYACSIVYICKYCVCPHGPYGLLDVGIKVSIYKNRSTIRNTKFHYQTVIFYLIGQRSQNQFATCIKTTFNCKSRWCFFSGTLLYNSLWYSEI